MDNSGDAMIEGSCLCGGVTYQAAGPLTVVMRCHCEQCRKASGAEFATNASVPDATFELLSGNELLRDYESSPGNVRVFCSRCGSPLFKRSAARPGVVRLRLGCVDSVIDERPAAHIYVAEKPAWSEIHDDLPRYDTNRG
jgi:hypothetical protein